VVEARRIFRRIVLLDLVAGGRDDEGAFSESRLDRLLLLEGVARAAEAEVDDAAGVVGGGVQPADLVGDRDARVRGRAGVPGAKDGLRVDADDAFPVGRSGSDRADGGAVTLAVAARRRLRVQRR